MKIKHLLSALSISALFFVGCQKSGVSPTTDAPATNLFSIDGKTKNLAVTQTFDEGFESATKTAYAAADVTFTSGSWNLNDALVGTSTSDAKTGSQSVRIRNTGTLSMNFDVSTGAST